MVTYGYLYDAEGRRVAKGTLSTMSCNPAGNGFQLTESYVLDQDGAQLSVLDGNSNWMRTNVYVGAQPIATYDLAGLHFLLTDPLGSRRVQVAANGEPELDCQSLPFGDQPSCFGDPRNPDSPTADANPLHFTGKQRDPESGNDYFGARFYSSNMGRFMSPDPSGLYYAEPTNPQSFNLYSYAQNNPLTNTDPTGMECMWDDGSFDAADDAETGNAVGCTGQGGTYVDPDLFENAQLTNGQQSTTSYGDWSGQVNPTLASSWTSSSGGVDGGSEVPLSGTLGPSDVGIMTQQQMISMLTASNFVYSPLDTALSKATKAHPGKNFRSASSICSVHLNILPGTGVNGVPASADFHLDEYSPLITGTPLLDPVGAAMHAGNDVIPDVRIQEHKGTWTGNQNCSAYIGGGGS